MSSLTLDEAKLVRDYCHTKGTDLFIYNGDITLTSLNTTLYNLIKQNKMHSDASLVLVTFGGDPDVAFKFINCLKSNYDKVSLWVPNMCKSAGTLIAIGADELVFWDTGELGPLDVQVYKNDNSFDRHSTLVLMESLKGIENKSLEVASKAFEHYRNMTMGRVNPKSLVELAANYSVSFYSELIKQIDPMSIGEVLRTQLITATYAMRLCDSAKNFKSDNLVKLLKGYPSHSFVISRDESREFFSTVRDPDSIESFIVSSLQTNHGICHELYDKNIFIDLLQQSLNLLNAIKPTDGLDAKISGMETDPNDAAGQINPRTVN